MWDRSYRWQQRFRLAVGVGVLIALGVASIVLARTSAAHRLQAGARDLASEVLLPDRQIIQAQVPLTLNTRVGTLVYRERADGIAQVVGRVVDVRPEGDDQNQLVIRLSSTSADLAQRGAILKGAPAALGLGEAVRLLLSPSTPWDEAMIARDRIWPSIRTHLIPEIMNGLVREISAELADPAPEDEELLQRIVENLHEAIQPLETDFVERLAKRAWTIVGVQGFVSGAFRSKVAEAKAAVTKSLESKPAEGKDQAESTAGQPFLSEKSSQELRSALEEEALSFWRDHRTEIIEAFKKSVDERRQDFEMAFRDRWSTTLYERVIEPAWKVGQDKVLESIESYVRDFTNRRLFTQEGGPRLLFAYILRCYLDISDSPLLILAAATNEQSDKIVYEPLLK